MRVVIGVNPNISTFLAITSVTASRQHLMSAHVNQRNDAGKQNKAD
jgi:hypothetical protein